MKFSLLSIFLLLVNPVLNIIVRIGNSSSSDNFASNLSAGFRQFYKEESISFLLSEDSIVDETFQLKEKEIQI